jgi:hypothetical protein
MIHNLFNKPTPTLQIIIQVNLQTKQMTVSGCIDDTITAMHMLTDAMQIVLKRIENPAPQPVVTPQENGGGVA